VRLTLIAGSPCRAKEASVDVARFSHPVDRKTSLKALGASLAALAATRPLAGEAKKSCGKKCNQKCAAQVSPCQEYWTGYCDEDAECRNYFQACCGSLASCLGDAYFACVDERL
jgi:hypothetical protein